MKLKFKMPTLKQAIIASVLVFIFVLTASMFLDTIKSVIAFAVLLFVVWAGYRLYKSTPDERIRWGKKNKILGLFFKEETSN